MKKQSSEESIYDQKLRQLDNDKEVIWNKERKDFLKYKMLLHIDKLEQKKERRGHLKYVSSIVAFIVLLMAGYQFLSSAITDNSEELSAGPKDDKTQELSVADEPDDSAATEEAGTNQGEEQLSGNIDLRLPAYIPEQVNNPEPQYIERDHLGGTGPIEVIYFESEEYYFSFAQSALFGESQDDTVEHVKHRMYSNDVLEEMEISGHPAFLRFEGDNTSYYSSLHIITGTYAFSLNTHGLEKQEIVRIANSIDLSGL